MLSAWGDESGSSAVQDPGTYVLGAVIIDDGDLDFAREAVKKLRSPSETKAHWYGRKSNKRDQMAKIIASLPIKALVVVRTSQDAERLERRRRKCLEQLLMALAEDGCESLTLESRGERDDKRDRELLPALQAQKRIVSPIKLNHTAGPGEPMLWLADAVCGAVVSERLGEPRWWKMISRITTIHLIEGYRQKSVSGFGI